MELSEAFLYPVAAGDVWQVIGGELRQAQSFCNIIRASLGRVRFAIRNNSVDRAIRTRYRQNQHSWRHFGEWSHKSFAETLRARSYVRNAPPL